MNYSEDPVTIDLYPESAFDEDLTPDVIGEDIEQKCNDIQKACKGETFLANATNARINCLPFHVILEHDTSSLTNATPFQT